MKVLLISHFKEGSGYSKAAIDAALCMDSVGIDVVVRNVKLGQTPGEIPERVLELEQKSSRGCDAVVFMTLPHHYEYNSGCGPNIGWYCTETSNFRRSGWASKINLMDQGWVTNGKMLVASRDSGVEIGLSVVPYAVDTSKFEKTYEPLPIRQALENFTFYSIGEFNRRKNFADLVKAFHLEFSRNEPVALLLKTNKSTDEVKGFCNEIKKGLRLYPSESHYHQEIIITERLSEDDMCRLHATCDVMVSTSRGEAFNLPVFDGLGFGKTPIVTANAGMEYINKDVGWEIDSHSEPVFGEVGAPFDFVFVGSENWMQPSINSLRQAMREAYSNPKLRLEKVSRAEEVVDEYSYRAIGELIKENLECLLAMRSLKR